MATGDGHALLLDFERTAIGRPEGDLTSTAVALDTFGRLHEDTYQLSNATYGHDVRHWPGYPTLRELRATTVAFQFTDQGALPPHPSPAPPRLPPRHPRPPPMEMDHHHLTGRVVPRPGLDQFRQHTSTPSSRD